LLEAELRGRYRLKGSDIDGVKNKLIEKMVKWKSKGYDTTILEKEIEGLEKHRKK